MRHALNRPATAPLAMHHAAHAIACALAGAVAAIVVGYATIAHFNRPLPPTANVAHYSKHQHRVAPHTHVRTIPLQPSAN